MTAQNEENIRLGFIKWYSLKYSNYPSAGALANKFPVWQAAIAQGEQERNRLKEAEIKLCEALTESQKREAELQERIVSLEETERHYNDCCDAERMLNARVAELEAELAKYKEAKPVAYVKYRVGDFPEFLPVIAGKVRTTENLSEYEPIYAHPDNAKD